MFLNGQVSQPKWACLVHTKDRTGRKKTHRQAATEAGCSKDLAKRHKKENAAFGDVYWSPLV